jgi:lysozyme
VKISHKGLALIKKYEGLKLTAYLCPANVWTIGYGSTGAHVKSGMRITEPEAEALLRKDVARFDAAVSAAAPTASQGQHDAMVSLAFNIGIGAFQRSTVLRKHKAGDHAGAADSFGMWNKGGGRVLNGLVRRRQEEAAMYRGRT